MKRLLILFIFFNLGFSKSFADDNIGICSPSNFSFASIVKDLTPAVVNISTTQTVVQKTPDIFPEFPEGSPFEYFFKEFFDHDLNQPQKKTVTSLGSGFIISQDGYIVTNNHVVEKADKIDVTLNDGKVVRAKIIGGDKRSDLALLKIESEENLTFVEFGNSDDLEVGDWVIAIGNPFGLGGTVTAGIVSARERNISDGSNTDFIQTDAAINRGNSGGPMFDVTGKLIGINTAIFSTSGGNIGIGFAIPSQTALPIIEQLRDKGHVVRGWLGVSIQVVTPAMADALGLEKPRGAYVVGVSKKSPAQKAGIKADDLIIEFDGKEIEDMYELPRIVGNTKVGKKVKIVVLRKEKDKFVKEVLTTKITELEQEKVEKELSSKDFDSEEFLGFELTELTEDFREKFEIDKSINGILITGIKKDSNANQQSLRPGDIITKVNQTPVSKVKEFIKIVDINRKLQRRYILLTIDRAGETVVATLNIE